MMLKSSLSLSMIISSFLGFSLRWDALLFEIVIWFTLPSTIFSYRFLHSQQLSSTVVWSILNDVISSAINSKFPVSWTSNCQFSLSNIADVLPLTIFPNSNVTFKMLSMSTSFSVCRHYPFHKSVKPACFLHASRERKSRYWLRLLVHLNCLY